MLEPQANLSEAIRDQPTPLTTPFVSVIIPVFNDAKRLKVCLAALAQQTYPKALIEVIVVDNGSDDVEQVKEVVAQFAGAMGPGEPLRAIATQELTPGSYAARNRGIALAKGEVLAFTDADCIPAADWIEQGVSHLLSAPNCGLVAGKISLFFQNPHRLTPVELFEKVTAFAQKEYLEQHKYGATANLFTAKAVVERVGLFNAQLKSSGDKEWGQRVASMGYRQMYADNAQVAHPARYSFDQLYRRTSRIVGGTYDLNRQGSWLSLQRNKVLVQGLLADLVPPLEFAFNAFRDLRLNGVEEKLKVSLVMFFVRYVSAWERIRLMLGGTSIRE
ncbi:MAG: glycosyltransferase family 2 protein [Cyanobacteria bacterium Co-bin13]|nr:glycosyltransferase family 2 protein [Cyanobacteria bacterium Co-bin13]